jgi:DNA (cytosine-5)-methyltransferase 1
MKKYTAIDLFSGCGGLTLGLKQAGFKVIGAVEIDEVAAETYLTNHPEVYLWKNDIRKISGKEILNTLKLKKGELGLLAGCPPCQGFSSMRTHNGGKRIVDRRNDLVFEYLRLVKDLRPQSVMMENVPALAENYRMDELKKELEKLGYKLGDTPTVLNAADYGVPQRRRRMILMGTKNKSIQMPEPIKKTKTVRDAILKLSRPVKSTDPLHNYIEKRTPEIIKIISLIPKNGGGRMSLPKKYWLECHKRYPEGFKDVYGRMAWDEVSSTITGGCISPSKGRFLHPSQNRSITLREAALLQTFPKNYYFSLKRGRQGAALMIGNALPPTFIKAHALAIKRTLVESR